MHLADHGVSRDAAEFGSDLAGAQSFRPKFLQEFNAFRGPTHFSSSLRSARESESKRARRIDKRSAANSRYSGGYRRRISAQTAAAIDDRDATMCFESLTRVVKTQPESERCFPQWLPKSVNFPQKAGI
jgi:hypothetical protein